MNYKEKFLKSINKIAEKEIDKVNINQHYLEVLESQDKEIERLNNIIDQTQKILYIKLMNENKEKIYIQEVIDIIENLKRSDKE